MQEAKTVLLRRLDDLDREVEKLEAEARKASSKTRKAIERQITELRAEGKNLRAEMSTWDEKSESAWKKTKQTVEAGLDRTESGLKKFWQEISK